MQMAREGRVLLLGLIVVAIATLLNTSLAQASTGPTGGIKRIFHFADGRVHTFRTKVYPCKMDPHGCFATFNVTVTLDMKGAHVKAPSGATVAALVRPNDPPGSYNPGYVYTHNYVVVYGLSGVIELYRTELDTEDYYNYNTVSNVWERPYCYPGWNVTCGGLVTGHYWDPNSHEGVDWLNATEASQTTPWPYNWQDATYLTTYVDIYGGFSCSYSDPASNVHSSCY